MNKELDWDAYLNVLLDAKELAKKKNADYGSDTLIQFGSRGCLIRMADKVNRLKVLIENQQAPNVPTEKIEDTCLDIINYAVYLLLLDQNRLVK